ncbi:MAG: ATP-dependent DNA ligase [Candidatus Xenobia bacterium]
MSDQVRITSPERVVYPESGFTKLQVAEYYRAVAERILPHVAGRPLSLVRCPQGLIRPCFYHRHRTRGFPASVRGVMVQQLDGPEEHLVIDDQDGLLALVQFGGLEIHPWGCRADRLDEPDRLVLDLDPDPELPWAAVIEATLEVRERLLGIGLESFAKTTGGKGMHVLAPFEPGPSWEQLGTLARSLAGVMVADSPDRYLDVMTRKKRRGKIYLDFQRNKPGATSVAAYSTRARPGGLVSTPVAWSEVTPALDPHGLTLATVPGRADPWVGFFELRQALPSSGE